MYSYKPVVTEDKVRVIEVFEGVKNLKDKNTNLTEDRNRNNQLNDIIGESKAIKELKYIIDKVANSTLPSLILGESGTGKDLVAKALHYHSDRWNQPFIPINSGAIPSELLESELFGHVKGSFTGAHTDKKGLVEQADGGTLFLDEIADMDPMLQVKILRFLDTGEYRPVGSTIIKNANVKTITATNKNLEECIDLGSFREDLYYRLGVITIQVPPLREREDDILLLADYFLKQKIGTEKKLSISAKKFLLGYNFPGNVRQLLSFIERGALLSQNDIIEPRDMINNFLSNRRVPNTIPTLQEIEKNHIKHVLSIYKWNKPEVANILNIGLRTLYRKIEEYGLAED